MSERFRDRGIPICAASAALADASTPTNSRQVSGRHQLAVRYVLVAFFGSG
jgi:hypothetical protein